MQPLISIQRVNKFFEEDDRRVNVLSDISFEVLPGEFLMLLGPSGSGKSTLLRLMAGLIEPSSGHIVKKPLQLGFIFQNFALFPWLNVEDNVAFGLRMKGLGKKKRASLARKQIEEMGLGGFEKAFPRELSGGMKQRVGIARALAIEPDVIFLDEPFSALDSFTAARLRQDLLDIWQEKKLTIIMVTHSIEEAVLLADRIAVLSVGPATIEAVVNNPLPRPRNTRSAKFYQLSDHIQKLVKF